MTVKAKQLSVRGDPSPSPKAGANPNPGLTLALVTSLITLRGKAAGPMVPSIGVENAPGHPSDRAGGALEETGKRGVGAHHNAQAGDPSSTKYIDNR